MSIQCVCGSSPQSRQRFGPTGRDKVWMILGDKCPCGRLYPVDLEELTEEQKSWVRRWNARMET